jgi:hypothetical protein
MLLSLMLSNWGKQRGTWVTILKVWDKVRTDILEYEAGGEGNSCVTKFGQAVDSGTALKEGRSRVRLPVVSVDVFYWHNPSGRTMAQG